MRILITGVSGLLGNTLYDRLVEQGHEVFGAARTNRYHKPNVECVDLTIPEVTEALFKDIQPEVVYHLAANASESKGQVSPIDMVSRNLLLSTIVLKSAINHKVKKFIFASSISVYGDAPTPYKESDIPQPKDVYGVNKLAFEQILKIMAKVYGFDYTILRPHNLYGPGQNMADPTKNVVALFMRRLVEGKPYTIFGEGKSRRAFTYVEDVAKVFQEALTGLSGQTLNVGSTESITIEQLSEILQAVSSSTVPVERKPLRAQEMEDFIADHTRQALTLTTTQTALHSGLHDTWDWVNAHPLPEVVKVEDEICLPQ